MLAKTVVVGALLMAGVIVSQFETSQAATRSPQDTHRPISTPPQRVISLNLCVDQFLLPLADRSQIAGLTSNAPKANMSAIAGQIAGIHILGNSAEEILKIQPDLVVGMPARRHQGLHVLRAQNYPTMDIERSESYADIVKNVRALSQALHHPERGEALITRMNRDLGALKKPGAGKVAAYYQRRGYMTGGGTLVDDLMQRVGLTNLATKLGKPSLSHMSLEEMVAAQPDFIIVESASNQVTDQGTEMLHHPALRNIPRISVPEAWTVCGGPAYVLAAQTLAEQIQRHQRR